MSKLFRLYNKIMGNLSYADGLPALLFRLILAPVLIFAGFNKLALSG